MLQQRAAIAAAAAEAGLRVPPAVQAAFEGPEGPEAAAAEAQGELETIEILVTAQRSSLLAGSMAAELGLLDVSPASEMLSARSAFAGGNMAGARSHALTAQGMWQSAEDRGWQRLLSIGAVLIGLLVLIVATAILVRMRRGPGGTATP